MTGKMPQQEALKIKEKFYRRGMLLAATTMAYSMAMEDDEAYKNATPRERYYYWFVRVPGLDEPLRIRIPFEAGLMFKAIPEALFQVGKGTEGGKEALRGIAATATQSVPGGSPPLPPPLTAFIEATTGISTFTWKPIVDARLKKLDPEEQYRLQTTEAAKLLGRATGVSPLHLDNFISKFTGQVGPAVLSLMNPMLRAMQNETEGPVEGRASNTPLVGSLFQANDAPGVVNNAYEAVREWEARAATFKKYVEEGKKEKAKEYSEQYAREIMLVKSGGIGAKFDAEMNKLTKIRREIESAPESRFSPERKRELLNNLRQAQIRHAENLQKQARNQSLAF
jgi:hypothetical protein